jgi:hypothetical protein
LVRLVAEVSSYLLLLHELRVRAVVDNIAAKDRGRQWRINLFGANIAQLAIHDELIALCAQIDGSLLAEKNERENVTVLL